MDKMQQEIMALVQAAMTGDKQALQKIMEIEQAAKSDEQAAQIWQMIQQAMAVFQEQQGEQEEQVPMNRKGAKLNYIKGLLGQCPEGYEAQKFAQGGRVCTRCIKQQNEQPNYNTPTGMTKTMQEIKWMLMGGATPKKKKASPQQSQQKKTSSQPKTQQQPVNGGSPGYPSGGTKKQNEIWGKRVGQAKPDPNGKVNGTFDKCGGKMKKHGFGGSVTSADMYGQPTISPVYGRPIAKPNVEPMGANTNPWVANVMKHINRTPSEVINTTNSFKGRPWAIK